MCVHGLQGFHDSSECVPTKMADLQKTEGCVFAHVCIIFLLFNCAVLEGELCR